MEPFLRFPADRWRALRATRSTSGIDGLISALAILKPRWGSLQPKWLQRNWWAEHAEAPQQQNASSKQRRLATGRARKHPERVGHRVRRPLFAQRGNANLAHS
eukprot:11152118-Alexandrium_andersonii.AAC.1